MKKWLSGKKAYLLAATAIVGVAIAWAEGSLTPTEAIAAIVVALQTVFLRAGIAKVNTP